MGLTFNTGLLSDAIKVGSTLNVGIGTSSPSELLHLYGANPYFLLQGSEASAKTLYIRESAGGMFFGEYGVATRMMISSSGNVGIGTSSPQSLLDVRGATPFIRITDTSVTGENGLIMDAGGGFIRGALTINYGTGEFKISAGSAGNSYYQTFLVNGSERMRITSGGWTKISNNGTYVSTTSNTHEINSNESNWTLENWNRNANPYGIRIKYANVSPNNTGLSMIYADDATALRFELRSNGGIANYQGNNVNLSDIRTKKDVMPLESYWDKFKAIEIVKFKYNDQTHDDFNIGVIAQQLEEIAPEFVDIDGWGETPEDGIPLKSIYTADLHHATIKVLQEAMAKIEELSAKVTALENR